MSDDDIYQRQKSEAEADARREREDRERAERDVFAERDRRERIEFERKEREAAALYDQRERGAWEKSKDFIFSKNAGPKGASALPAAPSGKERREGKREPPVPSAPSALPPSAPGAFAPAPKRSAAIGIALAFVAAAALAWFLHPSWGTKAGRDPFPSFQSPSAGAAGTGPSLPGSPGSHGSAGSFSPAGAVPFAAVPTPAPAPPPPALRYKEAPLRLRFEAKPPERQLFNVGPGAWLPQDVQDPGFLYAPDGPVWHRGYGTR